MPVVAPIGIASTAFPDRVFAPPPTAGVPTGGVDDSQADDLDIPLADLFAGPGQSSVAAAFVFAAPIPGGGEDIPPGFGGNETASRAVTPVDVSSKTVSSPKFTVIPAVIPDGLPPSFLHNFGLTKSRRVTSPVVKDSKLCALQVCAGGES